MNITVYTTPSCGQCIATKSTLKRLGVPFDTVDLATNDVAMDHVRALGYTAAPVVETADDSWSGFRPDKLSALAE